MKGPSRTNAENNAPEERKEENKPDDILNKMSLRKIKSIDSIILRTYSFISILSCDYHYSFVIHKEKRKASKHLTYCPISKIYDPEGQLLFDINSIELKQANKTKYGQLLAYDTMKKELESKNYIFQEIKKRESKTKYGNYDPITLTDITSIKIYINSTPYEMNMDCVENTLGKDFLDQILQTFNGTKEVVVSNNEKVITQIVNMLCRSRKMDKVYVLNSNCQNFILSHYVHVTSTL